MTNINGGIKWVLAQSFDMGYYTIVSLWWFWEGSEKSLSICFRQTRLCWIIQAVLQHTSFSNKSVSYCSAPPKYSLPFSVPTTCNPTLPLCAERSASWQWLTLSMSDEHLNAPHRSLLTTSAQLFLHLSFPFPTDPYDEISANSCVCIQLLPFFFIPFHQHVSSIIQGLLWFEWPITT